MSEMQEREYPELYRFSGDITPLLDNETLTRIYLEEGYGFSSTAAADIYTAATSVEEYTPDAVYDALVDTFLDDDDAELSTYMANIHDAL